ncbi:hypothetical protein F0562_007152 [Nyssa sinensis]|uniref:non-specific serine/threonine protein kinase n=1 Tax=Nyssa sinensis TaxID=561372 RepID=A0A5J5A7G6_9ASTE|nr:hypothetical protein F0562_007152 [Nyssa sinensis]
MSPFPLALAPAESPIESPGNDITTPSMPELSPPMTDVVSTAPPAVALPPPPEVISPASLAVAFPPKASQRPLIDTILPVSSPPPPPPPRTTSIGPTPPLSPPAVESSPPPVMQLNFSLPTPPSNTLVPPPIVTSPPPSPPISSTVPPPSLTLGTPSPPPNESSQATSKIRSTAITHIVGISGVTALVLLVFLILCFISHGKRKKHGHLDYKCKSIKDKRYAALSQHFKQKVQLPGPHVIGVLAKPFPQQPLMSSSEDSFSNDSGSECHFSPQAHGTTPLGFSASIFTYKELVAATDGFRNLLGEGGFGYVHKGSLPNGKEIAVKQLKMGSRQGEREFRAEVDTISRVHHKHLVALVGYCIARAKRLLVYEFVPNYTLEFHLHRKGQPIMDWANRLKIAIGSAKGLAYLHEYCNPTIIHRDVKAANILLDSKFEAKVSDFGLAKFFSGTDHHVSHVSTRVVGTFGYLAPEYASSGKVSDKSDVFSYGVMLLELITGRQPINTTESSTSESLVCWARPLLRRAMEDGNFDTLADPRLQRNYNNKEMARMVACAAASVRHSAWLRPQMSQIVRTLEGGISLTDLDEGIRPGHSTICGSFKSLNYDFQQLKEEMNRFNMISATQESSINRYSESTTECGLHQSGSSRNGQKSLER